MRRGQSWILHALTSSKYSILLGVAGAFGYGFFKKDINKKLEEGQEWLEKKLQN